MATRRESNRAQANRERDEAIEKLRPYLQPGATVRCVLRHVTRSGMTRWISLLVAMPGGGIEDVTWWAARALQWPVNTRNHEGLEVGGCGMDMGYHTVYSLARVLYPDGFECTGAGDCPSNDHHNYWNTHIQPRARELFGDDDPAESREEHRNRWGSAVEQAQAEAPPNYAPGQHHRDGGYALKSRWL